MVFDRFTYILNRLRERLWVKPLFTCIFSILSIVLADRIDDETFPIPLPEVSAESLETLLSILTGGMLVIATFAVGAMVSAYSAASSKATPRSFEAVISDDTSQNALSVFIGTFIFSVVGLVYLQNEVLGAAARTIVFLLTLAAYTMVIYTFVRWVDRIARLGRMGTTIENVEKVCIRAVKKRSLHPHMQACAPSSKAGKGAVRISANGIGYLQRIDMAALQRLAENMDLVIQVPHLPGKYLGQDDHLCLIYQKGTKTPVIDAEKIRKTFQIGRKRLFDDDPRFGIVVLSEIASRALSPAVNDPGTAIDVMGSLHRVFSTWQKMKSERKDDSPAFDRIEVPGLEIDVMMEDAFASIGRDGSKYVEVITRLQNTLIAISKMDDMDFRNAAQIQAIKSLDRIKMDMTYPSDLDRIESIFNSHFDYTT